METITLEYREEKGGEVIKREITFSSALLQSPYNRKSLFVIRVDGQSMEPLILHDSLVIADLSQKEFHPESIYLVYYDNRMWIKKAALKGEDPCFVSMNRGYEHLVYPLDEVRVIARALLTFTSL